MSNKAQERLFALSASHKVDNLETILSVQLGLLPAFPADYLTIQLYRYTVVLEIQRPDQSL